ncbi:putative histone deacetylase [Helianthus annuus]|nr:putative histone deacetylase [Helianthus annuus]
MADKEKKVCDSSSSHDQSKQEEDLMALYGSDSGWVEARTHCDHLDILSSDLTHIPTPDTPCNRCHHPAENWLCLSCKDVLCSRFINKHMLDHYQLQHHCLALSYSGSIGLVFFLRRVFGCASYAPSSPGL